MGLGVPEKIADSTADRKSTVGLSQTYTRAGVRQACGLRTGVPDVSASLVVLLSFSEYY